MSLSWLLSSSNELSVVLDYSAKQAHVELAERMKQRDAGMVLYP